jgi:hypothetical protein
MLITPFDRLSLPAEQDLWQAGASGDILKSCNFSGHAELVEA